jgi:hypothetical protein
MVVGIGFGVLFVCCAMAAILSFFVSVSLVTYERFFAVRQVCQSD